MFGFLLKKGAFGPFFCALGKLVVCSRVVFWMTFSPPQNSPNSLWYLKFLEVLPKKLMGSYMREIGSHMAGMAESATIRLKVDTLK